MKKLFIAVVVIVAVAATVFSFRPAAVIPFHSWNLPSGKCQTILSWDIRPAAESKHFSIERYIDGDINDAFIISHNYHHLIYDLYDTTFYTFDIEAWKDTDAQFIELCIRL